MVAVSGGPYSGEYISFALPERCAMRRHLGPLVAILIALSGLPLSRPACFSAQDTRTRLGRRVYRRAQAKRGEAIYFEHCVRCHGPTLMGGTDGAGALTGPMFNGNWNGVPLGQMLDRVRVDDADGQADRR